ncbi:hypothetical protein COT51_02420 [candidate division WWE3 bacterium CG08_land_8_20_14_0_20_41_15]|uniref:Peptidase M16 n=1 Tax=candidate division WWE3 bacterium CG08_land_8_20_14_0_20_41_15 TaxID=1975086 RepID=A0A2H0X9A9_UNCKA|nr:MAG: hypothetical protein COT51_02420 [candidate division WWE3 bacterium CG08_land_8_20_14_0_20_41_15]
MVTSHFQKQTLKNGLRLILVPNHTLPSVSSMVLIGAGSRYENKNNSGISHFAEHMFFKGTKKRPDLITLAKELDSIGAVFNAGTSLEMTNYYIKSAKAHLEKSLDVLSDILINSKFEEGEIEKEKGVITEEINMIHDEPRKYLAFVYCNLLYGDTPMGWDIAGTKESINSFKRETFIDYLNNLYQAQNAVLVIAGSFEEKEAKEMAEKGFLKMSNKSTQSFLPQIESQTKPATKISFRETDQTHLALGFRSFSRFDPDRYALEVLDAIFGGGMSSRLFEEAREKRSLCYYVYSDTNFFHDVGTFSAFAGVATNRLPEAVKVILSEFHRLADVEIPEEEIKKAKEYVKGHFILTLEDTMNTAGFYGEQEILEGKIETPEEVIAKIDAVSSGDLSRVAKRVVKENNLNLAVIGPVKDQNLL